MATDTSTPSFSRRRKWSIGFNVLVKTLAVLGIVVAANYISLRFFHQRAYLSASTRLELSPRTHGLLQSLTNRVRITLYYNKSDSLYDNVVALVNEYHLLNRNISVQTVDYLNDLAEAQKIKAKYHLFAPTDKNLVIFDCATNAVPGADAPGRFKIVPGDLLGQYIQQQVAGDEPGKIEFVRKPVAFYGELWFTSALLEVINPRPLKAYFLQGHGEQPFDDAKGNLGLGKFAEALAQNYIQSEALPAGTNAVPDDCNLLIIAGPRAPFTEPELARIDDYLNQGGRLFAAFNMYSIDRDIGLERILAKWHVEVSGSTIRDEARTYSGKDIIVDNFANHPLVNPLAGSGLYLFEPRMIRRIESEANAVDVPKAQEIAFSSTNAHLVGSPPVRPPYPLMVAVEKGAPKGTTNERGSTRILVAGDSIFLSNAAIISAGNNDFVSFAANWLLDRTALLSGIGPQRIKDYRLLLTPGQQQAVSWILLGAIPGGVLLLGGIVWLRRRK